jgi:transposase-like protein
MDMSGISKSQVARLCEEIDAKVTGLPRAADRGDWPFIRIEATYVKNRQAGRVVSWR